MKNTLEIETLEVQIRVVTVDGKRLTKAVFYQIPVKSAIIPSDVRLGYVLIDQIECVLFSRDGELCKFWAKMSYPQGDVPKENYRQLLEGLSQLYISI